jgi:hypothetical protein
MGAVVANDLLPVAEKYEAEYHSEDLERQESRIHRCRDTSSRRLVNGNSESNCSGLAKKLREKIGSYWQIRRWRPSRS